MKKSLALMVALTFLACVANHPSDVSQTALRTAKQPDAPAAAGPVKSPHGYVIDKDYEPGRFGGFTGDCSDDKNWPYYWQCMSENAGNGGFK